MSGFNFYYKNPDDFTYVSKKHWHRKQKVENTDQLSGMLGRPGAITGIVLWILDVLIYFILRFVFFIFDITHYAFKWIYNIIFGNFTGIIPKQVIQQNIVPALFIRLGFCSIWYLALSRLPE